MFNFSSSFCDSCTEFCFKGAVESGPHTCCNLPDIVPLPAAPFASTPLRKARDVSGLESIDGWSVSMATPASRSRSSTIRIKDEVAFALQASNDEDEVCRGLFQSPSGCQLSPIPRPETSAASISLFGHEDSFGELAMGKRALASPSLPAAKKLKISPDGFLPANEQALVDQATPLRRPPAAKKQLRPFKAPRRSTSVPQAEEAASRARLLQRFPAAKHSEQTGFTTAAGKSVSVSATALEKAQGLLLSVEQQGDSDQAQFCTDSTKTLQQHEEGHSYHFDTQTVENFLDDSFCNPNSNIDPINEVKLTCGIQVSHNDEPPKQAGFQTASGKKVTISESALEASKKLFRDCSDEPLKQAGFQTASGKKVAISESALEASKKLFRDCNDEPAKQAGFQTASGKRVAISESALEASKKLFRDCNDEPLKQAPSSQPQAEPASSLCEAVSKSSTDHRKFHAVVSKPEEIFCDRNPCRPLAPFLTYPESSSSNSSAAVRPSTGPVWRGLINTLPRPQALPHGPSTAEDDGQHPSAAPNKASVRPQVGGLLSARLQHKRLSLQAAVGFKPPAAGHTLPELVALGVHHSVTAVSLDTALNFSFNTEYFFSQSAAQRGWLWVGDGAPLRLTDSRTAGVEQFWRAFVCAPGVDKSLVSYQWFCNHYRLVVWKLAALEISFPLVFAGRCLTPDWLMLQLKYRYDREVDRAERSAIHKICEGDDVSSRTMVLCISKVFPDTASPSEPVVELCDGWYSLPACLDGPLRQQLQRGMLTLGTKLVVSGARLLGSSSPSHPLNASPSVMLSVSANSSRRARWYARLGFCFSPRVLPVCLSSVRAGGGQVGCTAAVVARLYPTLYLEKFPDGSHVVRSERSERAVSQDHLMRSHSRVEQLHAELQKQAEDELAQSCAERKVSAEELPLLQDGKEIYLALKGSLDPVALEESLTVEQRCRLEEFISSEHSRRSVELQQQALCMAEGGTHQRSVTHFVSARLVPPGVSAASGSYRLTLWRPAPALMELLAEGSTIKLFNVDAKRHLSGGVELVGSRQTKVERAEDWLCCTAYQPRAALPLAAVASAKLYFNEFDTVGFVAFPIKFKSRVSALCLTDGGGAVLAVLLTGGVERAGLEQVAVRGARLAVSNLSYRGLRQGIPMASAGQSAAFSSHPKPAHLRGALSALPLECPVAVPEALEREVTLLLASDNNERRAS